MAVLSHVYVVVFVNNLEEEEDSVKNEGPSSRLGCFFAVVLDVVMDIVQFLSPPVVLLGLENVVLVVVGKYVVEVFVLVKDSAAPSVIAPELSFC